MNIDFNKLSAEQKKNYLNKWKMKKGWRNKKIGNETGI